MNGASEKLQITINSAGPHNNTAPFSIEYTCCPSLRCKEEKTFEPREEYHLDNFFLYTNDFNF